jgi:hypothetical protein
MANRISVSVNGMILEFKMIRLNFESRNISSVFFKKNNKTLGQTLEHHRYERLRLLLANKYSIHLEKKIGDFLRFLKESNDDNYKCFLNKYGDGNFCRFSISENLNDRGIYCYVINGEIKYIGRCTDNFKKRINQGYGNIHPKNCFIDGQATNCHLNSIINSKKKVEFGVFVMTDKTVEEIRQMEKLILTCNRFEWNIQTS